MEAQRALGIAITKLAVTIADTPARDWTGGRIASHLELLEGYWSDYQFNHVNFLEQHDPDHPYFVNDELGTVQAAYISAKGELYDARDAGGSMPGSVNGHSSSSSRGATRLPRIVLHQFDGTRENWESFRDLFRSLVHDDVSLTDVDKLYYLKTYVQGEAKAALDKVKITEQNYQIAWSILESRYDHRRLLIQDHLEALKHLRAVKGESFKELQALIDELDRHRDQLRSLARPVDSWDDWFVSFAADAMDLPTRRAWEQELEELERKSEDRQLFSPSYEMLTDFLQRRCRTLTSIEAGRSKRSVGPSPRDFKAPPVTSRQPRTTAATSTLEQQCPVCPGTHYIGHCPDYKNLAPSARRTMITRAGLCYNCLRPRHSARNCPSQTSCQTCGALHHTSIHEVSSKRTSSIEEGDQSRKRARTGDQDQTSAATTTSQAKSINYTGPTLLPTAMIILQGPGRQLLKVRALLDPCSDSTLASMRLIRRFGQQLRQVHVNVTGVTGAAVGSTMTRAQLMIKVPGETSPLIVNAYGLKHIGIRTPSTSIDQDVSQLCAGWELADPDFGVTAPVEVVIGADLYSRVIMSEVILRGGIVAQRTRFGWVLTGSPDQKRVHPMISACTVSQEPSIELQHEQLVRSVQRLWSVEELPQINRQSLDDLQCEHIYTTEHSRDSEGRYVVPLPFKPHGRELLGSSFQKATRTLSSVHRRMDGDPEFQQEYRAFMDTYLKLGHMRALTPRELGSNELHINYIPHHGIWQKGDGGRKLRVVFNASAPTSSGYSLNDVMYSGPQLQPPLFNIIISWRRHRVAFCADVLKHFRQIKVRDQDILMQCILWSPSATEHPKAYALLTVTYGETCAPYLARRSLHQLAIDEGRPFPLAVRAINEDLYVDDFLTGHDNQEGAIQLRDELTRLLTAGGFELKKWVSNSPTLLSDIPPDCRLRPSWLQLSTEGPVNELGIAWDPTADVFRFSPPSFEDHQQTSKRVVLSELARLFDPAGWLAPVVVVAKLFMQDLWRAGVGWDDDLPLATVKRWDRFKQDLDNLPALSLPRWLGCITGDDVQLHVFADASKRAMAATVYIRVQPECGQAGVVLVAAKTKLSPIRSLIPADQPPKRMTIPRLELRAALLGAKLLTLVASGLKISPEQCHAWTDSRIVLHWIHSSSPIGNDLVDNYVHQIAEVAPSVPWRHVPTSENPADVATRGTSVSQLAQNHMWWHGPGWLRLSPELWPDRSVSMADTDIPNPADNRSSSVCCVTRHEPETINMLDGFSNLNRLLRVVVKCTRLFASRAGRSPPPNAPILATELKTAYFKCVELSQRRAFSAEIEALRTGQPVHAKSPLKALDPFLDDRQILRVGGRLQQSSLSYDDKHPVILDGHCHLATLVIKWAHLCAMHGGFRLTCAYAAKRAWIVGGHARIRTALQRCVTCAKSRARPMSQKMAALPASRVTPALLAFTRSGVDYAGPFNILRSKNRGMHTFKGYVAIFVCLATKAIHLELAGDMTTRCFLGVLSRFCDRRSTPAEIWSDNGLNFRGADLELRRMLQAANLDWGAVAEELALKGIEWRFISPSAPHHGGLWEAGVKSMKTHLRRVIGPRNLTYEEFTTVLTGIEATLNCRPLGPLTGDPDDLDALTPGHFLVGGPLRSFPRPVQAEPDLDHLSHWNLVNGIRDSFWTRWSAEYLNTLQQRVKWTRSRRNVEVNDLVLILDPSLITCSGRWPLGRVVSTAPGRDGLVRVIDVRTAEGREYTRPITKIALLPIPRRNTDDADSAE